MISFTPELVQKAETVKLLILDVDGVLSDNKLIYGDDGMEYKAFFTRDGHGMVMLQKSGIDIGIITGRKSPLTTKRMQDLKVKHVYQGVPDKLPTFLKLVEELGLDFPKSLTSVTTFSIYRFSPESVCRCVRPMRIKKCRRMWITSRNSMVAKAVSARCAN